MADEYDDNARKDALSFLQRHKMGVLATLSPDGQVHASEVYYAMDSGFNIYILTLITSRKFEAIEANPRVAFTVSSTDVPQTLQIEGVAMDVSLDEGMAQKKEDLFEVLNANPWFWGPITKLDPAETVVIWIKPAWVRWGDYAFAGAGTERVLKEITVQ